MFSCLFCTSCVLVFSFFVFVFESHNFVLLVVWKLNLNLEPLFSWFFVSLTIWTNSIKFMFILASINHLVVRFILELSVDYPFSKEFFSKSHGLPISYWLRLWITHLLLVSYFTTFIMSTSMKKVLTILKNLEQENQTLHESIVHLQTNQVSTSLKCISTTQPQPKEQQISVPNESNRTCSKFWSFVNQVRLVIRLHPH
jgi:hypothetical protein